VRVVAFRCEINSLDSFRFVWKQLNSFYKRPPFPSRFPANVSNSGQLCATFAARRIGGKPNLRDAIIAWVCTSVSVPIRSAPGKIWNALTCMLLECLLVSTNGVTRFAISRGMKSFQRHPSQSHPLA
jgi:hypothetical protein